MAVDLVLNDLDTPDARRAQGVRVARSMKTAAARSDAGAAGHLLPDAKEEDRQPLVFGVPDVLDKAVRPYFVEGVADDN